MDPRVERVDVDQRLGRAGVAADLNPVGGSYRAEIHSTLFPEGEGEV